MFLAISTTRYTLNIAVTWGDLQVPNTGDLWNLISTICAFTYGTPKADETNQDDNTGRGSAILDPHIAIFDTSMRCNPQKIQRRAKIIDILLHPQCVSSPSPRHGVIPGRTRLTPPGQILHHFPQQPPYQWSSPIPIVCVLVQIPGKTQLLVGRSHRPCATPAKWAYKIPIPGPRGRYSWQIQVTIDKINRYMTVDTSIARSLVPLGQEGLPGSEHMEFFDIKI